ncbi:hypothetical protein SAMN05421874_15310 [Nonomuraea maritima]|uniref:Uncharacterized protein n=1 Tax=Nonomuraea maritima TaxID=683260 RepID=A0A1G9S7X9_9ACTN|nr:hypothetical protein [Nonomuraea maritima]SDM31440.1 hypothetical protein SAMN05421874_15310 [Nonomuraea maritima]
MNAGWPGATNIAMDDAHVDAQIGYVDGNVTIYSISESDDPQRKYQVGRNYLDGGMPRRAESLIMEAAMAGHRSNEVAYYWVLATLSERSFDHLGPDEFGNLWAAYAMADEFPRDAWRQAVATVIEFVRCIIEEEERGTPDLDRFSAAVNAYRALAKDRQDEIHRHLEMIMNGWIQDQVEFLEAQHVQTMRLSSDRRNRVWKFFEPVPTAPRRIISPGPMLPPAKRLKVITGAALVGLGVLWTISLMASGGQAVSIVALALVLVWLIVTVKVGLPQRRTTESLPQKWTPGFGAAVSDSVDHWFHQSRPADPMVVQQWLWDTEPVRAKLKAELVHLYGGDHARVGPIRWLIKWHAESTAQQFRGGVPLRSGGPSAAVMVGNAALAIAGLFALISAASASFLGMLGAALVLGIGAAMAWTDALRFLAAAVTHSRDIAEANRRFFAEQQEYERWCAVLANRPTDAEMATWLDYDKMMIKSFAMKHYGLSNRDVIGHLTLTEAAPRCRRARVLYGPPRYSAYVVLLFLLTEGGVRQVTVDLDFATGAIHDERRTTFRYEMIASARVTEVGVRFEQGHRRVMAREEIRSQEQHALVLRRAFRLSLVNSQHIDVLVDNYEHGLHDRRENIRFLAALALDTSGVTGALRILEAVSAEGREWLAHERARRQRRLRDFRESQRFPQAFDVLRTPMSLPGTQQEKGPWDG